MRFGELLRDVRMRHRLTLKAVAEAAERSVSSISDIEHGRRSAMPVEVIESMCERLGIPEESYGLVKATFSDEGAFKVEVDSPLEKELFVTLRRSIQSRIISVEQIRLLIDGLTKLEASAKPNAESSGVDRIKKGCN